jgi:hypothetical protein
MVTFAEGTTVLGQIPLSSSGTASFNIARLSVGDHHVTAIYSADTVFASSNGSTTQTVMGGTTPTPTPAPISISGTISYCSNPVAGPVPNVTLTLAGTSSGSTLSDVSGNYFFTSLTAGGSYTVTPSKAAFAPGAGVTTADVIVIQRQYLGTGTPLTGCRLMAADVTGNSVVDTLDVVAVQRFFLGLITGTFNTGKYLFNPVSRSYLGVVSNQANQNYDAFVYGDVSTPFIHRP